MNNNQPFPPATPEEFHRYQKPRHVTPPAFASPPPAMPVVKPQLQPKVQPNPQPNFPAAHERPPATQASSSQLANPLLRETGTPEAANPAIPKTAKAVSPAFPQSQASGQQIPAAVSPQLPPLASPHTAVPSGTSRPQNTVTTSDNMPQGAPVVNLNNVYKIYRQGETEVRALDGINLQIFFGQFTAIVGPSGSGKSTLLHCLAGLDSVTKGTVRVAGKDLAKMNDKTLTQFRRDHIGFVFQSFNLMPTLTALENIRLPQLLAGKKISPTWENQIIEILNLKDRLTHKPSELSGGQQQRVAVARALVTKPALLVADEPTGNLDSASSQEVLKLLRNAASELGQSVVMVTHDPDAAAVADRVLIVKDGKITQELTHPTRQQLSQVI
ncbi:ABC transporter ATP-binding protein [Varibaculum vaginae]|uniref:ABC transporter ATP-binding protein n=1 Tax=Varibaculum vaginae TaxID=2364797 RepID=UPI001F2C9AEE|nr:ABC transporter ATP-binding protein [Varibaculum vaginae]